jgi:Tol biopolymer transport system component
MESLPPLANIYVVRADGLRFRQITSEGADRASRWVGGSQQISFIAGHGGAERVWTVPRDGGEVKPVTPAVTRLGGTVWSPDFSHLWFRTGFREGYLMEIGKTAVPFPDPSEVSREFTFENWSPDGSSIIGISWPDGDRSQGGPIARYDLRTHQLRSYGARGMFPCWMSDSRHVIFHEPHRLLMLDTQTGIVKPLLSLENGRLLGIAVSPDDRRIYIALKVDQADVWMASLASAL